MCHTGGTRQISSTDRKMDKVVTGLKDKPVTTQEIINSSIILNSINSLDSLDYK